VERAAEFAQKQRARLSICTPLGGAYLDTLMRCAKRLVHDVDGGLPALESVEIVVIDGSPVDAILERVGETGADLVIMSNGGLAEGVARKSAVPVIII
jgi:nucleotide-binding universal stress UspA family protein